MHISNDTNNFRNKKYLECMNKELKHTFRAYHKFIAYKNKLQNELTLSDEDKKELNKILIKYKKNIEKAYERVNKEDWR